MKRSTVFLAAAAAATICLADPPQYSMSWQTVDGGGMSLASGNGFEMAGTIGQPDAAISAGDGFVNIGGFWGLNFSYCAADYNNDGFVNGDDFDQFVVDFEMAYPWADFDGNGFVNGDDYDFFVVAFEAGQCE